MTNLASNVTKTSNETKGCLLPKLTKFFLSEKFDNFAVET